MTMSSDDQDDGLVRITLRIPRELHARIVEATSGQNSMNAEIIRRLVGSFPPREEERRLQIERLIERRQVTADQLERVADRLKEIDANIEALKAQPKGAKPSRVLMNRK